MADKSNVKKIASFTISVHGDGGCFIKANKKGANAIPIDWEDIQKAIRKQLRDYYGYVVRMEISPDKRKKKRIT